MHVDYYVSAPLPRFNQCIKPCHVKLVRISDSALTISLRLNTKFILSVTKIILKLDLS